MNFLKLTLLSGTLKDKLKYLVETSNDVIAKYLLEANSIVENVQKNKLPITQISDYITDYARQLTLCVDNFLISFLPKGNTPVFSSDGNWKKDNRQSGKPGKIVQKVIGKGKFKNAEYEQFVYKLKNLWQNAGSTLQLVSGEDIRKWYNCENYYLDQNTLGHSCMKHEDCSIYFDLYVEQPECQMLIALKDDKLMARALVWTINDQTFLDRVYYCEDCLYHAFINYATEHKWCIRQDNSLLNDDEDQLFLTPNNNYEEPIAIHFKLKLKRFYEYWPYVDSFRYLDADNMVMTTYVPSNDDYYNCSYTDGNYREDEDVDIECENCSSIVEESDLVFSEYYNANGCMNCMIYSELLHSYIYKDDCITILRANNDFYSYIPSDYYPGKDFIYCANKNKYVHKDNPYIIKINDEYEYRYDSTVF